MDQNQLSHHGIKGQKWGVRRFQLKNGKLTSAGKKRYAEGDDEQKKKEETKPKVKPISEMSDEELRAKINRIELERKYQSYMTDPEQQQKVSAGSKYVKEIAKKVLLDPMVDTAGKATKDYLTKQVDKYMKDPQKSIQDLKKMDVEKMSDNDLKRLAERLTNESKVNDSKRNANDRSSTLKDLKETKVEDLTGDQLKSVLGRKSDEVKLDKLNKGESTNLTKDEIVDLVEEMFEKKLSHSDMEDVDNFLEHHGIKGQKWGVRRFQRENGELTKLGKMRQTQYAKDVLKTHISDSNTRAKRLNKQAKKAKNNAVLCSEYMKAGQAYIDDAIKSKEYLSKIKSKEVEAGKDFVATKSLSLGFNWVNGIGYKTSKSLSTTTGINIGYDRTIY